MQALQADESYSESRSRSKSKSESELDEYMDINIAKGTVGQAILERLMEPIVRAIGI